MNATISIPDKLLSAAEEYAAARGLSRDEFIAQAVEFYMAGQRRGEEITEALNEVYDNEPSALDPALSAAQSRILSKDNWQ